MGKEDDFWRGFFWLIYRTSSSLEARNVASIREGHSDIRYHLQDHSVNTHFTDSKISKNGLCNILFSKNFSLFCSISKGLIHQCEQELLLPPMSPTVHHQHIVTVLPWGLDHELQKKKQSVEFIIIMHRDIITKIHHFYWPKTLACKFLMWIIHKNKPPSSLEFSRETTRDGTTTEQESMHCSCTVKVWRRIIYKHFQWEES